MSNPKTHHVRFRPLSGVYMLCSVISVVSGLPVYTLQSSFPSSQSGYDTTEFLASFPLFPCTMPAIRMFSCRII